MTYEDILGCKVCQDHVGRPRKQRSQGLAYIGKRAVSGASDAQNHIQVLF